MPSMTEPLPRKLVLLAVNRIPGLTQVPLLTYAILIGLTYSRIQQMSPGASYAIRNRGGIEQEILRFALGEHCGADPQTSWSRKHLHL